MLTKEIGTLFCFNTQGLNCVHIVSQSSSNKISKFVPKHDRQYITVTQKSTTTFVIISMDNPHESLATCRTSSLKMSSDTDIVPPAPFENLQITLKSYWFVTGASVEPLWEIVLKWLSSLVSIIYFGKKLKNIFSNMKWNDLSEWVLHEIIDIRSVQ